MPAWDLVISVDVEEEGLFCGRYPRSPAGVTNVRHLNRLEPLAEEFGFPFTLLVTYPVARDPVCLKILSSWQARYPTELGAHLHIWNTPPFFPGSSGSPDPILSAALPPSLLEAKLTTLLEALKESLGISPTAFRMGRFDSGPQVFRILARNGLRVDSSVVPCLWTPAWPEAFLSPADPFFLEGPGSESLPPLLEVPLTQVPWCSSAPRTLHRRTRTLPHPIREGLFSAFRYLGVLGIQPAWFSLPAMMCAVLRHRHQGGKVLHMFLHSSELMPGATPGFGTLASVDALLRKIRLFLKWLVKRGPVRGITLSGLYDRAVSQEKDWPRWKVF